MTPQHALEKLLNHEDLSYDHMLVLMRHIMAGDVPPVLLSAIVVALRMKQESVSEIAAAAQAMRDLVTPVKVNHVDRLVDIVGTGGDGAHTFNISTTVMFVASAAGARVAKHGGRSVSSKSGSADVLESLGIELQLAPDRIALAVDELNLGFMFAPNHHLSMKYAAPVRRELGIRTIFNVLGPLTNPAQAKRQLLGVYSPLIVKQLAQVLQMLGSTHALVVYGAQGLDEISPAGKTIVAELKNGSVSEYQIHPEDFGLPMHDLEALKVNDAQESKAMMLSVLQGQHGAARDTVVLNAAAALYVAGVVTSLKEGVSRAQLTIDQGLALQKLNAYRDFSLQA